LFPISERGHLADFYHNEARLLGVDTLKLSVDGAAEILKGLLPGLKAGNFSPPPMETVSLDCALNAYRTVIGGSSGKKFVIYLRVVETCLPKF
jgi:NADPH:quinone reductase